MKLLFNKRCKGKKFEVKVKYIIGLAINLSDFRQLTLFGVF